MGAFITGDNATMAYAGAKIDYKLGAFMITPSFTPGLYSKGDGKDLGNVLEFKSQVNIGLDLGLSTFLSMGYSHISNASLGDKNPGANSYSFNFSKQF
jgi:lipid A 3-O-deacylase